MVPYEIAKHSNGLWKRAVDQLLLRPLQREDVDDKCAESFGPAKLDGSAARMRRDRSLGAAATTMGNHPFRSASARHSVDQQRRTRPKRRRSTRGSRSWGKTAMATSEPSPTQHVHEVAQAAPNVSTSSPERLHTRARVSTDEWRAAAVGPVVPPGNSALGVTKVEPTQ